MIGIDYSGFSVNLAGVVVPVALYFLVLGLLNSRRRPQLLTARQDFILLIVALCPLVLLPLLGWLDMSWAGALAATAALAGGVALAAPRGHAWVIYNIPSHQAQEVVERALRSLHADFAPAPGGFRVADGNTAVKITAFAPLHNVSIRLADSDAAFARRFEQAVGQTLAACEAPVSPMAVTLLLVATTMLMAPLAMMAQRVPELVRLLSDLIH
jgi:hypothetical protein